MNIILVSAARRLPRNIDLADARTRLKLVAVAALVATFFMGAGAVLAMIAGSPGDRLAAEVRGLRAQLGQQRGELADVRVDSQREVNALALKLGELEAQSMRLNALGERLAEMGRLDDGEFDFDQSPAMGGPEGDEDAAMLPPSLTSGIDRLSQRFERQEAQLKVLQDLLLDHKVAASQRPSGMPVNSGYISSYFGSRIDPLNGHGAFHRGIDFAAPRGTPIHAVAEGVVTYAGTRNGYGNVVEVDHGNGYVTRYAHASRLLVHAGERVHVGSKIAVVGSTGRSTGTHCHFEVWLHGKVVNPLAYVRSHRG